MYAPRVVAGCGFACAPRGDGHVAISVDVLRGCDESGLRALHHACPYETCEICSWEGNFEGNFEPAVLHNLSAQLNAPVEFVSLVTHYAPDSLHSFTADNLAPLFIWGLPGWISLLSILIKLSTSLWKVFHACIPSSRALFRRNLLDAFRVAEGEELQGRWRTEGQTFVELGKLRRLAIACSFFAVLSLPSLPAVLSLSASLPLVTASPWRVVAPSPALYRGQLIWAHATLRRVCLLAVGYSSWLAMCSANIFDPRFTTSQDFFGSVKTIHPGFNAPLAWPFMVWWSVQNADSTWGADCVGLRWRYGLNGQNYFESNTRCYDALQTSSLLSLLQACTCSLMAATSIGLVAQLQGTRTTRSDHTRSRWRVLRSWWGWWWVALVTLWFIGLYAAVAPPAIVAIWIVPLLVALLPTFLSLLLLAHKRGRAGMRADNAISELYGQQTLIDGWGDEECPQLEGGEGGKNVHLQDMASLVAPNRGRQAASRCFDGRGRGGEKFTGRVSSLITGEPGAAAGGIGLFIGEELDHARIAMRRGVDAIVEEWEAAGAPPEMMENLQYVLHARAGSSTTPYQFGWMRDRDVHGDILAERCNEEGQGMTLRDFCNHPSARAARLAPPHVFVLRIYTTDAYRFINEPFRRVERDEDGAVVEPIQLAKPHPLPVTLLLLDEALKRLRAVTTTNASQSSGLNMDQRTSEQRNSAGRDSQQEPSPSYAQSDLSPAQPDLQTSARRARWGLEAGASADDARNRSGDDTPSASFRFSLRGLTKLSGSSLSMLPLRPPCSVTLGRLRWLFGASAVSPPGGQHANTLVLYRGMRDLELTASFMRQGGAELGVMSTTKDLRIAARYARGEGGGVIFRLNVPSLMQVGANLRFLSAFPQEHEFLYPPCTHAGALTHTNRVHNRGVWRTPLFSLLSLTSPKFEPHRGK